MPVCMREVYPNAPLVLVAAEVRHPDAGPLTSRQQQQLKVALAADFPLARPLSRPPGVVATFGPGGLPQISPTTQTVSPRFVSRDQSTSATFHQDALVVEATNYPGFESFLALIERVITARISVGELDGVERLGLRYIDEIRAPGIADTSSWQDWIQPSLLGPNHLAIELQLVNDAWQGISAYSGALDVSSEFDKLSLVLRYGVGDGYALAPEADLRRKTPPPGPFFLIDIDSYWGPATTSVPSLDWGTVARVFEGLHAPVRVLFENSITTRLRDEVLRRNGK